MLIGIQLGDDLMYLIAKFPGVRIALHYAVYFPEGSALLLYDFFVGFQFCHDSTPSLLGCLLRPEQ